MIICVTCGALSREGERLTAKNGASGVPRENMEQRWRHIRGAKIAFYCEMAKDFCQIVKIIWQIPA